MFLLIIALIILGKLIPHWHRRTCLMKAGLTELKSETENWKTDLSLGFKKSITFNFNVLNFKSTDIGLSSLYRVKQKTTAYSLMSFFCLYRVKQKTTAYSLMSFFRRVFAILNALFACILGLVPLSCTAWRKQFSTAFNKTVA